MARLLESQKRFPSRLDLQDACIVATHLGTDHALSGRRQLTDQGILDAVQKPTWNVLHYAQRAEILSAYRSAYRG